MLLASALVLLGFLGSLVYWQFGVELRSDSQTRLQNEVIEVEREIHHFPGTLTGGVTRLVLSDDEDQKIYFVALNGSKLQYESYAAPLPVVTLLTLIGQSQFHVVKQNDLPYRIYHTFWQNRGHAYDLFVYQQVGQEFDAIKRIGKLLFLYGGAAAVVAILLNIWVASRALQPARKTWQVQQEMMLELSHELQTPLATLKAIVAAPTWNDDVRARAHREIDEASSLVQDVLYLAKLRTNPKREASEAVCISDVTDEVFNRFEGLANRRHIVFQGDIEAGLYVSTTTERWARLLSTLVKNVVDHAPSHTSATYSLATQGQQIRLMIRNEVFNRCPPGDTQRPTEVKGIGLSIVRRLVTDMGGQLSLNQVGTELVVLVDVPKLMW